MRNLILFMFVVVALQNSVGQNETLQFQQPNEGVIDDWEAIDIISDFGRRNSGSRFHKGVDISLKRGDRNDEGDGIIAPVDGIVSFLQWGNGYKILTINGMTRNPDIPNDVGVENQYNFGFGHIFDNTALPIESGDFVLLRLDGDNWREVAILNTETNTAISDFDGAGGTVTWPVNSTDPNNPSVQYPVTNRVDAGDAIAPIGVSGYDWNPASGAYDRDFSPHIHLYLAVDPDNTPNDLVNAKDPLQFIDNPHPDTDYNITIEANDYTTNQGVQGTLEAVNNLTLGSSNIFYSGTERASVRVRCTMQNIGQRYGAGMDTWYRSAVMELDDIMLFITKVVSGGQPPATNELFMGSNFESRISHGARLGNTRYPAINNPPWNTIFDIALIEGSFTQQGIKAQAYGGLHGGGEYDDFYFSDIYTRISKNHEMGNDEIEWAYRNKEAKYPDGVYVLNARATDVNGDFHYSSNNNPTTITIDNFRPYITKLEVHNLAGNVVYWYEWVNEGGGLVLKEAGPFKAINPYLPTSIKFWTSEEMSNGDDKPSVSIGGRPASYETSSLDRFWQYTCNTLTENSLYDVVIAGTDMNGNELFDMPHTADRIALEEMPVRTGADFSDNGSINETFDLVGCASVAVESLAESTTLKAAGIATSSSECPAPEGEEDIPQANFSYTLSGVNNNIVTFSNTSEFADFYSWNFDLTETSTSRGPHTITYPVQEQDMAYQVSLTVSNFDGVESSKTEYILVPGTSNSYIGARASVTPYTPNWANPEEYEDWHNFEVYAHCSDPNLTIKSIFDWGDGNRVARENNIDIKVQHVYKPSIVDKVYEPTLTVSIYNGERLVGSLQKKAAPILIKAYDDRDIEITFTGVGEIIPGEFELKAKVDHAYGNINYTWVMYKNDILSGSSAHDNFSTYSTSNISTLKHTYSEVGEYLITLLVSDQYGHWGYKEYIVNVGGSEGCATLDMYIDNCSSQFTVVQNKPTLFSVGYNLSACPGKNSPGQIIWYMSDPDGVVTQLGCESVNADLSSLLSTAKCISFPKIGEYKVYAEVLPYDKINESEPDQADNLRIRNDGLSTIVKTVKVVGMIEELPIAGSLFLNAYYVHQVLEGTKFGNVTISNADNVYCPDAVIKATESITLSPGFSTIEGSSFTAKIEPYKCNTCETDYRKLCRNYGSNYRYYDVPKEAITVQLEEIDCLIGKGEYKVRYYVDDAYGHGHKGVLSVECTTEDDCGVDESNFCYRYCMHFSRGDVSESTWLTNSYFGAVNKKELTAFVSLNDINTGNGESNEISVGCWAWKSTDSLGVVGVEEKIEPIFKSIRLYPNPTEGNFTLDLGAEYASFQQIEILNKVGQLVYKNQYNIQQSNYIDVNTWPEGVYFVRAIKSTGTIEVEKLIIKR